MKPQNVEYHEHWFKDKDENKRADICTLKGDFNDQCVIWFVEPNVTITALSLPEARELLRSLGFTEEFPDQDDEDPA